MKRLLLLLITVSLSLAMQPNNDQAELAVFLIITNNTNIKLIDELRSVDIGIGQQSKKATIGFMANFQDFIKEKPQTVTGLLPQNLLLTMIIKYVRGTNTYNFIVSIDKKDKKAGSKLAEYEHSINEADLQNVGMIDFTITVVFEGQQGYLSSSITPRLDIDIKMRPTTRVKPQPKPDVQVGEKIYILLGVRPNASSYEILGIAPTTSEKDIHQAYKKMALKWHPDRYKQNRKYTQAESAEVFKLIEAAYQSLQKK